MSLSIVIPVWNKFNFTRACLKDLSQLTNDNEIIIVDNGSTDETQKELQNNTRIRYHRLKQNVGFARGCNIGYDLSTQKNVLFLNNDIRVHANHTSWTTKLVEKCDIGLVGPTMGVLSDRFSFVKEANMFINSPYSYMSGWCVASSKKIWQKLQIPREDMVPQVFSEEFGLAYFEDTDLSFRARVLEIPFEVVEVPVIHFGQQTSSQLNTGKLYTHARQMFINKWGDKK